MISNHSSLISAAAVLLLVAGVVFAQAPPDTDWHPVQGHLMTRWAKDVDADKPWPEYPRPKMVREDWLNLNGLWDYAIGPKDAHLAEFGGDKILVPFCAESALSGVGKAVGQEQTLWYRRNRASHR